jgi:hypothetical protein
VFLDGGGCVVVVMEMGTRHKVTVSGMERSRVCERKEGVEEWREEGMAWNGMAWVVGIGIGDDKHKMTLLEDMMAWYGIVGLGKGMTSIKCDPLVIN